MPSQDKGTGHEPSSTFKAKLGSDKIVSYEDLLLAQYIDDAKKGPHIGSKSGSSPYLGRYSSLEEGLSRRTSGTVTIVRPTSGKHERSSSAHPYISKQRTASAKHRNRPVSASPHQKPKIDAKFIADPELWDPATPRGDGETSPSKSRKSRPQSAPSWKNNKNTYSEIIDQEVRLALRPKRKKPLYKRQPYVIRCTAYKNGDRDVCALIAAPSVKQLLEACTMRLQLNSAARRIFLEDGYEIFETSEIPKDGEIYVSNGESFKNPYKPLIKRHEVRQQLNWTMTGITLPDGDQKSSKKKFQMSKRFQDLLGPNKRRIMVFLNGQHTNCGEVISDLKSMSDFLADVTGRLNLRSTARVVYNWHGKKLTSFDQIPILDTCLQDTGTPVLGPVWVSCGAGFSPSGAKNWFEVVLADLKKRLTEANSYKSQLEAARESIGTPDSHRDKTHIQQLQVLSMTAEELDKNIQLLTHDVETTSETRKNMKDIYYKLCEKAKKEQAEGISYTQKHIKELGMDDPAVGGVAIKLKVYRNGQYSGQSEVHFNVRQASRGVNQKQLFERLLDQCANSLRVEHSTKFARRMFDSKGDEIKSIAGLQNGQEVFISTGEAFITPYVLCVQPNFEPAEPVEWSLPEKSKRVILKHYKGGDYEVMAQTNRLDWKVYVGIPPDHKYTELNELTDAIIVEDYTTCEEIDQNQHLLRFKVKEDPKIKQKKDQTTAPLLYPTIAVSAKKSKSKLADSSPWPKEPQTWAMSKDGYVHCKGMPQLVMAVLDVRIDCKVFTKLSTHVNGFAVGLQKKQDGDPAQQWRFSTEGTIYSVNQEDMILTYLGNQLNHEDSQIKNEVEGIANGFHPYLAVCEKIEGRDARLQRFALKQERFDNLGQWKHTDHDLITNAEFNKLAYSWPVNKNGEINEKFDWPMEFNLIVMAPPLKSKHKQNAGHAPIRLIVMKNGETDPRHCAPVVGPDLTNMIKDTQKAEKPTKGGHSHSHSHSTSKTASTDKDDSVNDFPLHCDGLTFRELEFRLFLERSTSALNLPFAARRLFDKDGIEHHSLSDLERDQLVYATCGELWIDPNLSKAEQQRRFLLTNLASDIAQIRQFCALRDSEGYVIEVEGAVVQNARLVLNHCPEMQEQIEIDAAEELAETKKELQTELDDDLAFTNQTAHERSHQKMDAKEDKLKWPWEKLSNDDLDGVQESPRRSPSPMRSQSRSRGKTVRNTQKFIYTDGFISCEADDNLVLGVISGADSQMLEVVLTKRKVGDGSQLWIIKESGLIHNKGHRDMVLTISMPTNQRRDEGLTLNYVSCQVILAKRKSTQFGSANQKWRFDEKSGYIYAFNTNHLDTEITAANKSNVCTYAVTKDELDQPGYTVTFSIKNNKQKDFILCTSCARAMRGKNKLTKLPSNYDFSCATGHSKVKELKQASSLRCLQGKVDLSTFEAINTLDVWEQKFNSLQEEMSVRTIAKEISAADKPRTVKIYAYKNGDGRSKEGQLIIGSTMIGLLDQCTYRLGLGSAAQRLYTRDGQLLYDIDDLIGWALDHYTANLENKPITSGKQTNSVQSDESEKVHYEVFNLETPEDSESYMPVNQTPMELTYALFEVTSTCNNHIALVNYENDESTVVYEVILGRDTESTIILHHPDANNIERPEDNPTWPQLPASGKTEKYWISWVEGHVTVGKGFVLGEEQLMSREDTLSRNINHIVVASPGAATQWTFHMPVIGTTVSNTGSNSGPTEIDKLINKVELDEDDDADVGSKKDDLSTTGDTVTLNTGKKSSSSKAMTVKSVKLEPPPIETILKYPIEVWASVGDGFIKPEKIESDQLQMKNYRKLVSDISYQLQTEKHKLRQLRGRRFMEQNAGVYESTGSSEKPVVLKNHWMEPSYSESVAFNDVYALQAEQDALKEKMSPRLSKRQKNRLYKQPTMKRVLGYNNGEPVSRSQYVWGENAEQLLINASTRLNLRRQAKFMYTPTGQQIEFEELERDQLVCFSVGGQFQHSRDTQKDIEIRANWTRARKQNGDEATNIGVHTQPNPQVDVDPFGPPSLASRSGKF